MKVDIDNNFIYIRNKDKELTISDISTEKDKNGIRLIIKSDEYNDLLEYKRNYNYIYKEITNIISILECKELIDEVKTNNENIDNITSSIEKRLKYILNEVTK